MSSFFSEKLQFVLGVLLCLAACCNLISLVTMMCLLGKLWCWRCGVCHYTTSTDHNEVRDRQNRVGHCLPWTWTSQRCHRWWDVDLCTADIHKCRLFFRPIWFTFCVIHLLFYFNIYALFFVLSSSGFYFVFKALSHFNRRIAWYTSPYPWSCSVRWCLAEGLV